MCLSTPPLSLFGIISLFKSCGNYRCSTFAALWRNFLLMTYCHHTEHFLHIVLLMYLSVATRANLLCALH